MEMEKEMLIYEGVFRIFQTDVLKILKLSIRPIGLQHPQCCTLLHAATGPTVS
jgi:hypothetical protein